MSGNCKAGIRLLGLRRLGWDYAGGCFKAGM